MDLRRGGKPVDGAHLEKELDWEVVRVPIFEYRRHPVGKKRLEWFPREGGKGVPPRKKMGVLTLWVDPSIYATALSHVNIQFILLGLLSYILSGWMVGWMIRKQLRRLSVLAGYAEELGRGEGVGSERDPETRPIVIEESEDEIGRLFQSFLKMKEQLRQSWDRIEEQNAGLERTVEERTRELQGAIEELKSLDKMKDRLLSSVSHEMRTPLTSIRSFSEILLEYGEDESLETRREFLAIIKAESERLSRLISDILDMAQIEAGKLRWKRETFDLRELVLEATRAAKGLGLEKNVFFTTDLPMKPLLFHGDRDRIQQVLFNLLSNAWKFSPLDDEVETSLRREGSVVVLEIRDRGPGFSSEDEKLLIFERFQQGGGHLTSKPDGTGLGLSISKGIVEMHGGRILALARPGGGAVFRVELPLEDAGDGRQSEKEENARVGQA